LVHLLDLGLELVAVGIKLGVLHGELVPLELLELRSVAHRANRQQPLAVPDGRSGGRWEAGVYLGNGRYVLHAVLGPVHLEEINNNKKNEQIQKQIQKSSISPLFLVCVLVAS
jgi:hypothetical protein